MNLLSKNEERIRKQLNQEVFPFDEAQWQAAKNLLDQEMPIEKKKNTRTFWLWMLPLTALLLAGGWWIYEENDAPSQPKITMALKNNVEMPAENLTKQELFPPENNEIPYGQNDTNYHEAIVKNILDKGKNNYWIEGSAPSFSFNLIQGAVKNQPDTQTPATGPADNGTTNGLFTADSLTDEKPGNATPVKATDKQTTDTVDANAVVIADSIMASGPDSLVAVADTMATDNAGDKDNPPGPPLLRHSISLMAGFAYPRILSPVAGKYSNSPYFGVMYTHSFNKKLGISTGAAYSQVKAGALSKTYSHTEYSFGVEETRTTISAKTLHYFEIPLWLRYSPAKRISFIAGANAGYLLNAKSVVNNSFYSTLGGTNTSDKITTAYRRGFSSWDVQWQFGAEVNLLKNKALHVGALVSSGLFDVTSNSYYNDTHIDRNRRFQLHIRYEFLRF